jgi:hypothetical protein
MKLKHGSLFLFLMTTLLLTLNVAETSAVEPTAKIVPTEGTVYTDIFLQIRGLEKFLEGDNWPGYRDMELYLYWDDKPLILGLSDPGSGDKNMHYFDVHLSAPNEHPYSDLGNHTIYIEIYQDWAKYLCNFTLTFEIIELLPCNEYLALNSTYSVLLANYSSLNASNNALQTQYNDLNNTYHELLADYYMKLANYSSLSTSYDSLSTSYDSLQSNNDKLTTSHNAIIGELGSTRNLGYVFMATTMFLLATAVYFAVRKPKITTT